MPRIKQEEGGGIWEGGKGGWRGGTLDRAGRWGG